VRYSLFLFAIACAKTTPVPDAPAPPPAPAAEPAKSAPVTPAAETPPPPEISSTMPPCTEACAEAAAVFYGPTPHRSDSGDQPTWQQRDEAFGQLKALCEAGDEGACVRVASVRRMEGANRVRFRHWFSVPELHIEEVQCFIIEDSWFPLEKLVQPLAYFTQRVRSACDVGGRRGYTADKVPSHIDVALDFSLSSINDQLKAVGNADDADFMSCVENEWGSTKSFVDGQCNVTVAFSGEQGQ